MKSTVRTGEEAPPASAAAAAEPAVPAAENPATV